MTLVTLSPTHWAQKDVVEEAERLASVESVEHHRIWATCVLEAILTLARISGRTLSNAELATILLESSAYLELWEDARSSEQFNPVNVPNPMLDALETFIRSPMRDHHFAKIVAALRHE